MASTDLPLWQRVRPQLERDVVQWFFDVAVGDGNPELLTDSSEMVRAMYRLSRLRIDAVGQARDRWLLVELRPNAGLGAFGHINAYRSLWERDPPDSLPAVAYLVSDRFASDVGRTAVNAGIRFLTV